jgi:hypothetical protein
MSATHSATNKQQPVAPKTYTCRHIFHDGHRCGSPALRGDRTFCFYHRSKQRPDPPAPNFAKQFAGPTDAELILPFPEDRAAVQTGIAMVQRALGTNRVDIRRANSLLYSLQLAAVNLPPHPRVRVPQVSNLRPGNATSKSASNQEPFTSNLGPIVDDIEDSPDLGPLAPVLEHGLPEPEEECEPSLASIINTYLNSPPPPPPVELDKRPYDFDTLQLLRRTLATTTNPETATRIRKALEEEALLPNHNLHIQASAGESEASAVRAEGPAHTSLGLRPRSRCSYELRAGGPANRSPEEPCIAGRPIHGSLTAMGGDTTSESEDQTPDPTHLQHRCRTIRLAFLPRSARPLAPNLPTPTPPPPTTKKQPTTLPTLHAVADRLPHPHFRPKVLGHSPMFSKTYRKHGGPLNTGCPILGAPRQGGVSVATKPHGSRHLNRPAQPSRPLLKIRHLDRSRAASPHGAAEKPVLSLSKEPPHFALVVARPTSITETVPVARPKVLGLSPIFSSTYRKHGGPSTTNP